MNKEISQNQLTGKFSPDTLRTLEEIKSRPPEIPWVKQYNLAEEEGRKNLQDSLRRTKKWTATKPEELVNEAFDSGVLVDTFTHHLIDLYKLEKPKGISLEEYLHEKRRWENTEVTERSWVENKGKFVLHAHESEFKKVARSRNIFIYESELQDRLSQLTYAVGGGGVGAGAAVLAALTGVENIRIADPGTLQLHRFNRFPFADIGDIGENLAVIVSKELYTINPFMHVECIPQRLGNRNESDAYSIEDFLRGADIGLEVVDRLPTKRDFRMIAESLGVHHQMVSDLGDNGGIVGFDDNVLDRINVSPVIRKQLNNPNLTSTEFINLVIDPFLGPLATEKQLDPIKKARDNQSGILPQSGISAFVMAGASVLTMLDYLREKEIPPERSIQLW